ncbi:MAG: thymidylate kinase [Clostridiales bacterium]|nr:thymidylate kinase [Clostridiales bacterium]
MIIVIEGTDGSGKQTQTQKLFDYLVSQNIKVKRQSFPNYESESSVLVKKYLNGDFGDLGAMSAKQCSTFFAVDRLCTMQNYKEFLNNKGVLLLDRYVSSNILHQASKIKEKKDRDEFISWLEKFEHEDLNLPKPDITFFLDLKPELSKKLRVERGDLKAGTKKDIHEAHDEYMLHCYNVGCEIAIEKNWKVIKCYENDKIKTIDEIHNEIKNIVNNCLS